MKETFTRHNSCNAWHSVGQYDIILINFKLHVCRKEWINWSYYDIKLKTVLSKSIFSLKKKQRNYIKGNIINIGGEMDPHSLIFQLYSVNSNNAFVVFYFCPFTLLWIRWYNG